MSHDERQGDLLLITRACTYENDRYVGIAGADFPNSNRFDATCGVVVL